MNVYMGQWTSFYWSTQLVGRFTISTFILDFELLQAKFHFLQNPQRENATSWCIMVIVSKLLNIPLVMMKYYCLRVSRRDVRKMGNTLPVLYFHPECVGLPIPSCFVFRSRTSLGRFSVMKIHIRHAGQLIEQVWRLIAADCVCGDWAVTPEVVAGDNNPAPIDYFHSAKTAACPARSLIRGRKIVMFRKGRCLLDHGLPKIRRKSM